MSISFAEFRARDRCAENVKMISSSSRQLIEKFRAENVRSSRIEFRAENEIVTNWQRLCFFLLVDRRNECEIYIVRHDENQI